MKQSGNKVLVIILIIVAILAIAGGAFAYVFFATDMLKSEQTLFAKYLTQNIEELTQITKIDKLEELKEKLKQNKHEETITVSYTEAGENVAMGTTIIEIQKDPIEKKEYGYISLETQEPEDTLKLEYMHDQDMYSLRFTNAVKQFLSIENSNLKEFARTLGMEEEMLERLPDSIDFENLPLNKLKLTEEEKNTEIKRYVNAIYNNIPEEKYTKSKNTVITVNGKTITTNAYILTLNMQDIKALTLKLLETLKQDEIILSKIETVNQMLIDFDSEWYSEKLGTISFKDEFVEAVQLLIDELTADETTQEGNIVITIYEQNRKTVRIKAEEGKLGYITLDTTEVDGKKQIDFNYTNIDNNNTQLSYGITIVKENNNNITIKNNMVYGEEQENAEIGFELTENRDNTKLNIVLSNEEGKVDFSRDINFINEIDYKVNLDSSNNIVLNQLSIEQMATIFTLAGEQIETEYLEVFEMGHIVPLIATAGIVAAPASGVITPLITTLSLYIVNQGQEAVGESELSELEAAQFNAAFLTYEGNKVSTAQVNALLNTVFQHNKQELASGENRYVSIIVNDGNSTLATIEDGSSTTVPTVSGGNYYTVTCTYTGSIISSITVTKVTENNTITDVLDDAEEFTENEDEEDPTITSENAEYNPAELAAITTIESETNESNSAGELANISSKITGLITTIGTIVIVMILIL